MAQVSHITFGAGTLVLLDRSVTPNIPVPVARLQDVSLDFSFQDKELMADLLFPIASARSGAKLTGKAKFADVKGSLIGKVLGAAAGASGYTKVASQESHAAGTSINATNVSTWTDDLGVRDNGGALMSRVTSAPAVGQYSVAAGAYTFNASETGTLYFTYSYTVAGSGFTYALANNAMGATPSFELVLFQSFVQADGTTSSTSYRLYSVNVPKLSVALKNEDFTTADLEFSAQAHPTTGKVADISTSA